MASPRLRTALALVAAVLAAPAAVPAARSAPPADAPSLTHLSVQPDGVRAWTDPDSAGGVLAVTWNARTRRWSRPAPWTAPATTLADSLGAVRVFAGGLFDQFPRASLPLGDGFTLARRDTGVALLRDSDGRDFGWPVVTDDDIDHWGTKVRVGLPTDYPEQRLRVLLARGELRNEPGPTTKLGGVRWFGLRGGFAGGTGQIGGLIGFDTARGTFTERRQFALVEASVTRLYAWRDELWVGTARFGDNAIEPGAGLFLYRPARNEWRQFTTDISRISGDLVWDIAGGPEGLWVATDGGLSLYRFDRRSWSSWYWHRVKDGGFELTDEPHGDLSTREGR